MFLVVMGELEWDMCSFPLFCPYLFTAHYLTLCGGREYDLKVHPVKRHNDLLTFCIIIVASNYINGYLFPYMSDIKLLIWSIYIVVK